MGEYLSATETYLRLALKAQNQCRATLETLAVIKNPPNVAFVKQANIAHGPQQVNNSTGTTRAHAQETKNSPSELLEELPRERLDIGTAGASSSTHTTLEAVGTIDGAGDTAR